MRKSLFLLPALALGLSMASCSNEDSVDVNVEEEIGTNYLNVSLVSTMGTRGPEDQKNYEDGEGKENAVTDVRFYFFDENGNAAKVKKKGNTSVSYYDWENPEDPENSHENTGPVEKKLNATLILNTEDGDKKPFSIVAILNPPSTLGEKDLSLEELNKVIEDYSYSESTFVMSNSIYSDKQTKMEAVEITGKLHRSKAEALADPVIIYVERVLAKVTLKVDLNEVDNKGYYETSTESKKQEFDGKEIFVKFLGWNTTAISDKSYLMKNINEKWEDDLFNLAYWNYAPYFRSFWAINPSGVAYKWGSFNVSTASTENTTPANAITNFEEGVAYIQENAAKNNAGETTEKPTQVIIAAQLVDKDGKAMEFGEWAGERYTVNDLKTALAKYANLYRVVSLDGKISYSHIEPEDIELKTATEAGQASKDVEGRYYVYAQLADSNSKDGVWAIGDAEGTDATTAEKANAELLKLGGAKVWTEGYTYYYFDIRHIAEPKTIAGAEGEETQEVGPGVYGVVRNHVYKANIKELTGLGTPVFKPSETIYPEKPVDDNTFIGAQINILSWRIVEEDIELNW